MHRQYLGRGEKQNVGLDCQIMHILISSADDLLWQVIELATKDWASIADLMLLQPRISFHGSDFFKPGKQVSPVAFSAYQCCMLKHLCMAEQLLFTCGCAFLSILLTCAPDLPGHACIYRSAFTSACPPAETLPKAQNGDAYILRQILHVCP